MRISTKGRGIIRAQQGAVARPNPKENYKLPEDQRYQAQTRGMKDFAIEWYKERAKQPKYQSQVNESNLANITDQINRAEYVEPSKFYSNPNVYKGKVGNVTQAAQVAMRQNKGAAYPAGLQYTYNAPSFPFSGRFGDVSWHEGIGHMVGDNNPQILKANPGINNRVDYESSTPLESQVYSSQPNERHADTWGFRGANVNMKDANGNYYIMDGIKGVWQGDGLERFTVYDFSSGTKNVVDECKVDYYASEESAERSANHGQSLVSQQEADEIYNGRIARWNDGVVVLIECMIY
mgnify:CR=1 FL=1